MASNLSKAGQKIGMSAGREKKMINKKASKLREGEMAKKSTRNLKKDQDKRYTEDIGRAMRFCLNLSFALIIAFPVFFIFDPQWFTSKGVIVYLIPVVTTILFFLGFLRLLKTIENYAIRNRNIELVSRIIWEFNKSSLIRLTIGKVQTFIEEE